MLFKKLLPMAMLPLGACTTLQLTRAHPAPPMAPPLVVAAECKVEPVEPGPVDEPPMPPALERPAGTVTDHPADWFAYVDRRRERAELAGLYFQGERDAVREAYETNAATQRVCATWAKQH